MGGDVVLCCNHNHCCKIHGILTQCTGYHKKKSFSLNCSGNCAGTLIAPKKNAFHYHSNRVQGQPTWPMLCHRMMPFSMNSNALCIYEMWTMIFIDFKVTPSNLSDDLFRKWKENDCVHDGASLQFDFEMPNMLRWFGSRIKQSAMLSIDHLMLLSAH